MGPPVPAGPQPAQRAGVMGSGGVTILSPPDFCPVCPPGLPDAAPPLGPPEAVNGGQVTSHECGTCGAGWSTWWHDGWPVDRLLAPVAPERTAANARDLRDELKAQARERRAA